MDRHNQAVAYNELSIGLFRLLISKNQLLKLTSGHHLK